MKALRRHGARIAITLLPVLLAVLHGLHLWRAPLVAELDNFIYDARLRASMPGTLDPRIVIVDIDDASLQQLGQWPWSRDRLAALSTELLERQQAAVLGFDVLFVEADTSSGLEALRRVARAKPVLAPDIEALAPSLDHDAVFAAALRGRPAVLGFYFTETEPPRAKGRLPLPALPPGSLPAGPASVSRWNGFVGSIPPLAAAAPAAGFLNVMLGEAGQPGDSDGVVRAVPLIAGFDGPEAVDPAGAQPGYYESLALAVWRLAVGSNAIAPVLAAPIPAGATRPLEALRVTTAAGPRELPLSPGASVLVPYRGPGGPHGGAFRHVSAAEVLRGALAPGELKGRIVLVGSTAPGLEDLRSTPVGAAFAGVEVHANIVSGLLDGRLLAVPDYADGYDLVMILAAGLVLAFGLSLSSAPRAAAIALLTAAALVGANGWLYLHAGLVLPLAASLLMVALAFVLNMSWGYFIEARASRDLARLFGSYVPRELVEQMRASPEHYSMRAENRELSVMFCDMRGFTRLAEGMAPEQLQAFLNGFFSRLTEVISRHRGTVDKYMGDCVMAFWGAPVALPDHAALAVRAALDMVEAVRVMNEERRAAGQPEIKVGIGINTGLMSVGDMGSLLRRSYTVVGDAVNLASRLEGLGPIYGVPIVASAATREAAPGIGWLELDAVRVQGKAQAVRIFTPAGIAAAEAESNEAWQAFLAAYRAQQWPEASDRLRSMVPADAQKVLYRLYAERLASMSLLPRNPQWDGATTFDSKSAK